AARVDRGQPMVRRLMNELHASAVEKTIAADEQRVGPLTHKGGEGCIDLAAGAGFDDLDLQPHSASSRLHVSQSGFGIDSICRMDEHGNGSSCGNEIAQ